MKYKLVIRAVTIAGLLLTLAASLVAGTPVRLAFHDTTIASGAPLNYAIYADSSLSGYTVSSYQLEFTYNTTYFTFVGATSTGTIASSWGVPTFNEISPGTIRVSAAGVDTLAGEGKLVVLQFNSKLFTGGYNGYASFVLQSAGTNTVLNQGSPSVDFRTGTVTLTPGPSITISPNTALLTKGDVSQFSVSGGHSPYTWSTTSPSVASIDPTGNLTGLNAGTTLVVVSDSAGYVDTSGSVEVRAFKLSFRDTSCFQGQILDVPLNCTNLTGLGITSGQFGIAFDQSRWTVQGLIQAGGLLSTYAAPTYSVNGGTLSVSFAGTSPLAGSGVLLYVRMQASTQNYGGTNVSIPNAVFNENLIANVGSAYLTVQQLSPVTVSPNYATTLVVGDSLQFQGSGGVPPYAWTVSGSGRTSISSSGWLRGFRSGLDTVRATDTYGSVGQSGPVTIYDFRLSAPDTLVASNGFVDLPLMVTPNDTGFIAYQMTIGYPTNTYVHLDSILTGGTLSAAGTWALSSQSGSSNIAVTTPKIFNGGKLCVLRFGVPDSTPRPSTTSVTLSNVLFNEGIPRALTKNGSFTIINGPIFGVYPGSASLYAAVGGKDSAMVTVRNTGSTMLTSNISVVGTTVFSVSTGSVNVAAGDSAKITVYFQPTSWGPVGGTVRFNTNDSYHSQVDVAVSGATPYPVLGFSVASINFGTVKVGEYKDTTVTISNTGNDTLQITSIAGTLASYSGRPMTAIVAPGHSFVDTIRFAPLAGGTFNGRISVTSNSLTSPDTMSVSGSGNAVFPVLSLSTSAVAFGSVIVGHFKDTTVTISNVGTDTLRITSITASNAVFSARPTIRTVLPGQSFSDTLRFAPALAGGYSGRIFVISNAPSSADTITVTGTGSPVTDIQSVLQLPEAYSLDQNFPNPFNPSTIIRYGLLSKSTVRLTIFNILGQKVEELVNGEQAKGFHSVVWKAAVPSGVYFYRIDALSTTNPDERFMQIRKMILMK
jgi:hypothetical protein